MAGLIHLIRHLEPTVTGVMLGQLDPPLANEAHPPLTLAAASVFCSPLVRSRRTAELFFPLQEIHCLPQLAEISLGEWDGLAWSEIEARWPVAAREKLRDWYTVTPPGAERWSAFETRVGVAWERIRGSPLPCAVVAHAGVNSVLARMAAGQEISGQQYGEVVTLEIL
jgi:broad specificity phosphatase PhoE